eukprot:2953854-Rhodomonas_salina.1
MSSSRSSPTSPSRSRSSRRSARTPRMLTPPSAGSVGPGARRSALPLKRWIPGRELHHAAAPGRVGAAREASGARDPAA